MSNHSYPVNEYRNNNNNNTNVEYNSPVKHSLMSPNKNLKSETFVQYKEPLSMTTMLKNLNSGVSIDSNLNNTNLNTSGLNVSNYNSPVKQPLTSHPDKYKTMLSHQFDSGTTKNTSLLNQYKPSN